MQPGKCVGDRELDPANVSLRISSTRPPWIDDICHKTSSIIVHLLRSNHAISSLQNSFVLFLNRQRLVIGDSIGQLLIRSSNLARVIGHDCTRSLRKVGLSIKTTEARTSNDHLIGSRVNLKLELIGNPPTRKTVDLIELVHLPILGPQSTLWFSCTSRVK